LIAATVLGSHQDEASVKTQMERWFPEARVSDWTLLRRDEIWDAQPEKLPGQVYQVPALPAGIFVAGEESANASIDGAIQSGVRAATAVRRYLQERI
jgi:hypothetical protein